MIPVFQTKIGFGGNCLAAALASILELPLDEVPETATDRVKQMSDLEGGIEQDTIINTFLHDKGLILYAMWYENALGVWKDKPEAYGLGGGKLGKFWHVAVVQNGNIVHDPHKGSTMSEIDVVTFLIPKEEWYKIQKEHDRQGEIENFMDPKPSIEMVGS